jgi:hypothetical protein
MDAVWGKAMTAGGGGAQVTRYGVTEGAAEERSRQRSRFLIAREGAKDADVLVLRLPDGQTALPVFGLEEEAGMFLWLETAGKGWRIAEILEADLATLLRESCAGVRRIVHPFAARCSDNGPTTVDREDFLRTMSGERSRRGERAGHKLPPRTPAWVGEGFG